MKTVYFSMPLKMRRNLKFVILLSISWMFVMFYYFQSGTTKVSFSKLSFFFQHSCKQEILGKKNFYLSKRLALVGFVIFFASTFSNVLDHYLCIVMKYYHAVAHNWTCRFSHSVNEKRTKLFYTRCRCCLKKTFNLFGYRIRMFYVMSLN